MSAREAAHFSTSQASGLTAAVPETQHRRSAGRLADRALVAADQKGGLHCAWDCVLDLYVPFDVQEPGF